MWGGNGKASGKHGEDGGATKSREMILPGRMTGKVAAWKGKFGWIQPDFPIQHPLAAKHGGRVFLNQQDVEASIEGEGSAVSFFVYTDGVGLGAAKAIPAEGPGVHKDIHKTSVRGFTSKGGSKPALVTQAAKQASSKGVGKSKSTGRETLTANVKGGAISGRITTWKGNYGWIKAYDMLDIPGFTGDLFLDKRDVQTEVVEGGDVIFHVYRDSTGKLGAEGVCSAESVLSKASNPGSLAPVRGRPLPVRLPEVDLVPLPEAGDGSREDAPGLYKMVHFAYVKETESRESKDIARVEMDHVVEVVEIVMMEEEDRIRGRIAEPAGWISLVNTCTGDRWAEPLDTPQTAQDEVSAPSSKPTPHLARERITSVPTTGEVVQWKGGHGWLMPSEMLEHPLAAQRGGRVFIGRADLAAGTTDLTPGQIVQFHVYADSSGLGGEECEEF